MHEPMEMDQPVPSFGTDEYQDITFGLTQREDGVWLAWFPFGGSGEVAEGATEFDTIRNLMTMVENMILKSKGAQ